MAALGNTYLPFADLVKLEQIDTLTFRSVSPPFSANGTIEGGRVYGGHVCVCGNKIGEFPLSADVLLDRYMQSAWAACQTVQDGFVLHSISGNFILAGLANVPFVYTVKVVRDGRSYCTRTVNVTQLQEKGIAFTCIASFQRVETSPFDVQESMDVFEKYNSVLQGRVPGDFDECPGMDVPYYWQRRKDTGINAAFPGLQMLKVAMGPYNESKHPLDRRQLIMYRTIGDLAPDPNLHLVAHLYASDRNSLFIVANAFDVGDVYSQMGSLTHTVTFHAPMEDLMFGPSTSWSSPLDDSTGKYFCKEDWTTRASQGRAMYHSNLWTASGVHAATIVQDGMIRLTKKAVGTVEETAALEEIQRKWNPRTKL